MWPGVACCGQVWPDVARCGQTWPDVARCGQLRPEWPIVARSGQMWPDVARCGQLRPEWPDVVRCGQKWPDVASCGRSDQMWPVVALAPPLQTLQIPCRFAAIACRPLADPLHIPAAPLPFLSRPLQVSCMSLGYSLGVPLAPVLQFPCGSPAGALQGIEDSLQAGLPQARSPLAVSLRIPSRSPLQSSGSVSAVPLHAIRRAIKIPCRQGPRRHLAVPLQFPCGPLQISCRALAVLFRSFLRFPAIPSHISWRCPASSLAVSLQFPCRNPPKV